MLRGTNETTLMSHAAPSKPPRAQPNFNFAGVKPAMLCGTHKLPGMQDVRNRMCEVPGCRVQPCFNFADVKPAVLCGTHKLPGMVDVKNRRGVGKGSSTKHAAVSRPPTDDGFLTPKSRTALLAPNFAL